jgi:hypothetical protein
MAIPNLGTPSGGTPSGALDSPGVAGRPAPAWGTRGPGTGRVCQRAAPSQWDAIRPPSSTLTITAATVRPARADRPGAATRKSPHDPHLFCTATRTHRPAPPRWRRQESRTQPRRNRITSGTAGRKRRIWPPNWCCLGRRAHRCRSLATGGSRQRSSSADGSSSSTAAAGRRRPSPARDWTFPAWRRCS